MTQPIFMVGARGCGKTTVGEQLSKPLGYGFVDTDLFMRETIRMTVAEIVTLEGWPGFRRRESSALQEVAAPGRVIATGGGIVLSEENRRFMRGQGTVIYLHGPAELLAGRLLANPEAHQRPSLTGRPIAEEMADVLAARDSLYRDAAHHIVDAAQTPEQIVDALLRLLRLSAA